MAKQAHLQAIISAVDRLSPALGKIGINTTKTKALIESLNNAGFAKLRGSLNVVSKTVADVGSSARHAGQRFTAIAGMAAAGTAVAGLGFAHAAKSAGAYAASIQDASDRTGINVEQLQKIQGAFRMGGVEAEGANEALMKLNKGMADAAAGKDKSLLNLLSSMGVRLRNAKGEIVGVADVLPTIANSFMRTENPAVRARMAVELFGRAGMKLVPTLAKGRTALYQTYSEMVQGGKVMSEGTIKSLDATDEAWGELGVQMRVLQGTILGKGSPAMQILTERLSKLSAANKDVISNKVGNAIAGMAEAATKWVADGGLERLAQQLSDLKDAAGIFVERMGGFGNVVKIAGALILAGPVMALLSLGAAFGRLAFVGIPLVVKGIGLLGGPLALLGRLALSLGAVLGGTLVAALQLAGGAVMVLGRALLLNPIGLAVTAIAAGAFLIWKNWETLGPKFEGLWQGIKATVGPVWDSVAGSIDRAWTRIQAVFAPMMAGIEKVQGAFSKLFPSFMLPKSIDMPVPALPTPRPMPRLQLPASFMDLGQTTLPMMTRLAPAQPGLAAAGQGGSMSPLMRAGGMQTSPRVQGELKVRFENAPPGMRAEPGTTNIPGFGFNPDVGHRSFGGLG